MDMSQDSSTVRRIEAEGGQIVDRVQFVERVNRQLEDPAFGMINSGSVVNFQTEDLWCLITPHRFRHGESGYVDLELRFMPITSSRNVLEDTTLELISEDSNGSYTIRTVTIGPRVKGVLRNLPIGWYRMRFTVESNDS